MRANISHIALRIQMISGASDQFVPVVRTAIRMPQTHNTPFSSGAITSRRLSGSSSYQKIQSSLATAGPASSSASHGSLQSLAAGCGALVWAVAASAGVVAVAGAGRELRLSLEAMGFNSDGVAASQVDSPVHVADAEIAEVRRVAADGTRRQAQSSPERRQLA